jgi:DNA-directed RNA polymerase subunit RPC12/RpoP
MPNIKIPPACATCSQAMALVRMAPYKDYDEIEKRTYGCPRCGHEQDWIVKELKAASVSEQF